MVARINWSLDILFPAVWFALTAMEIKSFDGMLRFHFNSHVLKWRGNCLFLKMDRFLFYLRAECWAVLDILFGATF